jgi:signal transduction histidine kinase
MKDYYVEAYETEFLTRDGEKRTVMLSVVPSSNVEGVQTFVGVFKDITDRKKAEQELLKAEKMSMSGRLARSIAHEVRNPLTNINLALEQLEDEIEVKQEDADLYLSMIKRGVSRVNNLINDLLNSSKPKDYDFREEDLNLVVNETLELTEDRLRLKSMRLTRDFDEKIPTLSLDRAQLKIALLNIFINAIEAMQPEQGHLLVKTRKVKEMICLEVRDNGRGMTEEEVNQVFDPFFTGKKEGTGLGMTTTQNILKGHHARIEIESEPGKGTSFFLYFLSDPS